jgi:hypothetical protein
VGRTDGKADLEIVKGLVGDGKEESQGVLVHVPKLEVYFTWPPLLRSAKGLMVEPEPVHRAKK